jgi:hypothetical protein
MGDLKVLWAEGLGDVYAWQGGLFAVGFERL